ncbi:MAG: hypothetical protein HOE43_08445 [Chloroflexi bacterium]|nr:hypothetical protein [Chloroflexota bacterium]
MTKRKAPIQKWIGAFYQYLTDGISKTKTANVVILNLIQDQPSTQFPNGDSAMNDLAIKTSRLF